MPKNPTVTIESDDLTGYGSDMARLKPEALGCLIHMRALYARELIIPDDPREVAKRCMHLATPFIRHWSELRQWFRPIADGLVCPIMAKKIDDELNRTRKISEARKSLCLQAPNPRPSRDHLETISRSSQADDMERAHDAGACAYGGTSLSTPKDKKIKGPAKAAPKSSLGRVMKPLTFEQRVQAFVSDKEACWTPECEGFLKEARYEYSKAFFRFIRSFRSGDVSKPDCGTTQQGRRSWAKVMLEHPDVTPRELRGALFLWLDKIEADQQQGISIAPWNFLTFFSENVQAWEDYLPEVRARIAEEPPAPPSPIPLGPPSSVQMPLMEIPSHG